MPRKSKFMTSQKTIMLVFGTRPEAIKMAPIVHELKRFPKKFKVIVTVTGQHKEMLDQVLKIFEIVPDYDLKIMKPFQDLYDISTNVLIGLKEILKRENPRILLVHGDTTTSTMAALAAFYQRIQVGHVEAGLRTYDKYNPWPEEMNRQVTSRLATYHFAPTELSKNNLVKENIPLRNILVTGNTVIDSLYMTLNKINGSNEIVEQIKQSISQKGYPIGRLVDGKKLVLVTGHRRESFGDGFVQIGNSLLELGLKYPDVDYVYPMHMNPNVRDPISDIFKSAKPANLFLIEPLDYLPFIYLMNRSTIILTDSGGIQEEAPSLGKPVLVMRETTERPEVLKSGLVKLVGTNRQNIVHETSALLDGQKVLDSTRSVSPYGNGEARMKIVDFLSRHL